MILQNTTHSSYYDISNNDNHSELFVILRPHKVCIFVYAFTFIHKSFIH